MLPLIISPQNKCKYKSIFNGITVIYYISSPKSKAGVKKWADGGLWVD